MGPRYMYLRMGLRMGGGPPSKWGSVGFQVGTLPRAYCPSAALPEVAGVSAFIKTWFRFCFQHSDRRSATVRKRGEDLSAAKPVFGTGRILKEIKGEETAAHRGTEGARPYHRKENRLATTWIFPKGFGGPPSWEEFS